MLPADGHAAAPRKRRLRRKAIDMERLQRAVAQAWAVASAWAAAGAQALLLRAMEAPAAPPGPPAPPTLLPTMKGVAFWNAAAAAAVHGEASTLELRATRAVDAAVEWALAPVLYCCVLADALSLPAARWPSPEVFSAAVVSLMLDLLVVATSLATRLSGFFRSQQDGRPTAPAGNRRQSRERRGQVPSKCDCDVVD